MRGAWNLTGVGYFAVQHEHNQGNQVKIKNKIWSDLVNSVDCHITRRRYMSLYTTTMARGNSAVVSRACQPAGQIIISATLKYVGKAPRGRSAYPPAIGRRRVIDSMKPA